MFSEKYKFCIIHPPKTGGNSLHFLLKDFYDIKMSKNSNQNGNEGINPIDNSKHHYLSHRVEELNDKVDHITFLITVRNPFDHMVSWYYWENINNNFENYIKNNTKKKYDYYTNIIKGYENYKHLFIRMENQKDDINNYFSNFNIKFENINIRNKSLKRNSKDYKTLYTEDTKKIVNDIWNPIIKKFNYKY